MKKILLAPLAVAIAMSTVQADNNGTVAVPLFGKLISSLNVSLSNAGITLPDVTSPQASDATATVTLNCNADGTSSVAYTGNSNPYAHGTANASAVNADSANKTNNLGNSTGTCAELTVSGQSGYHYKASMLTAPAYSSPFQQSLITCNVDADGSGVIGTDGLYCGARVTITSAANGGTFNYSTSGGHGVVAVVYD